MLTDVIAPSGRKIPSSYDREEEDVFHQGSSLTKTRVCLGEYISLSLSFSRSQLGALLGYELEKHGRRCRNANRAAMPSYRGVFRAKSEISVRSSGALTTTTNEEEDENSHI